MSEIRRAYQDYFRDLETEHPAYFAKCQELLDQFRTPPYA